MVGIYSLIYFACPFMFSVFLLLLGVNRPLEFYIVCNSIYIGGEILELFVEIE